MKSVSGRFNPLSGSLGCLEVNLNLEDSVPNQALHQRAILLRSIAAGELNRWAPRGGYRVSEKIAVSELKHISVFYEGDIYDLACILLKLNDARDKGTNSRSRHTVKGLITKYSMLTNVDFDQIMKVIVEHDLPLGATVEYDDDVK